MKKLILILAATCLSLTQATAQEARPDSMPTHGRHFAQVPDPEQAAKLEIMPPRDGMQPPMMPEGDFSRPSGQARPPMPAQDAEERAEELKKKQEKREKKMKKILTEEQFAKWKKMQQQPPRQRPEK